MKRLLLVISLLMTSCLSREDTGLPELETAPSTGDEQPVLVPLPGTQQLPTTMGGEIRLLSR